MTIMIIPFKRWLTIAAVLLLFAAAFAPPAAALSSSPPETKPVQVFDIAQRKVVQTVPNDKAFQKMAKSWLKSVTGLAPQVTADNSCTFVYRVPLMKPMTVKTGAVTVTTQDLFVFYCQDNPPLLLVFDEERKPYLLLFKENIKPFIRKVGIPELSD